MISRKDGDSGKPKPFSVSFSNAPKKPLNLSQNSRPQGGSSQRQRHRHLTHDESDEEEEAPVHEEVTGFDTSAGGAISKNAVKEKEPLVIKVESKNNWRDRPGTNRRSKNILPPEVQAAGGEAIVETEAPSMSYGLSLARPRNDIADDVVRENGPDVAMTDTVPTAEPEHREPLTQDEIALQALIRETEGGDEARRSDLVIESVRSEGRYDETTSFRADVASRPEQASLEAYEAVPVEEFGAALLRGMGWKEGQSIGRGNYGKTDSKKQNRVPERRPGFLGIGAKDISGGKGAELEIGAWGKAAMRKGSRKGGDGGGNTEGVYMPIVMKSKTTGEQLTEEEFKIRRKEASEGRANEKLDERSSRHSTTNGKDRDRSRRYEDDESENDRDRSRRYGKPSSRRDRSRSSGAHDRRSHHYDDDGAKSSRDSRRYRDRDDSDYRSRPRSKDRSHRDHNSSRRDKDYHRTRERDRDSDRTRSDRDRHRDSRR